MPGASEAAIQSIELSASMFFDISKTMQVDHLHGAVGQLLGHLQPEVLGESAPVFRCNCSRSRIEKALVTLGQEELNSMIEEQHGAQVDCHFCNKRYEFSEGDLKTLLAHALGEAE
jgi:molecular chaperone Hsp33